MNIGEVSGGIGIVNQTGGTIALNNTAGGTWRWARPRADTATTI